MFRVEARDPRHLSRPQGSVRLNAIRAKSMAVRSARIVIGNRNMTMTQRYDMVFLPHCGVAAAKKMPRTVLCVLSGLVDLLELS